MKELTLGVPLSLSPSVCDLGNTGSQLVSFIWEAGEAGIRWGGEKGFSGQEEVVQAKRSHGGAMWGVRRAEMPCPPGGLPGEDEGPGQARQWFSSQPRPCLRDGRSDRQVAGWAVSRRCLCIFGKGRASALHVSFSRCVGTEHVYANMSFPFCSWEGAHRSPRLTPAPDRKGN